MVDAGTLVRCQDRIVKVVAFHEQGHQWRLVGEAPQGGAFEEFWLSSPDDMSVVEADGAASSADVLAGLSTAHMAAASASSASRSLISTSLVPYAHQYDAVYRAMLPQPRLRFLLGDEPGTGKTIMGGLYAREAQRLGHVDRCLVVCPAHLVTKWQDDVKRFLGGGLDRIDASSVHTDGVTQESRFHRLLRTEGSGFWVVSLELAAMNPVVLEAIAPDRAGWDLVIVDEAHRLTPSAETYYAVGNVLKDAPRFLAMTATPHRGDERYFRALMHLVDPEIYPEVADDVEVQHRLKPGRVHMLRRMKEELYGRDGTTRLFKDRVATNVHVPLSTAEQSIYSAALELVESFFLDEARTLGRMVYGKRAASSMFGLAETLRSRLERMGTATSVEAVRDRDLVPDETETSARDVAEAVTARSKNKTAERSEIKALLARMDPLLDDGDPRSVASKWGEMVDRCLAPNGIVPGGDEQLVVFTEYADTADWLVDAFEHEGYTARRYSGRDDHAVRDAVRHAFMARAFQVIVSTDAGNEGIDLQSARVLVNWDIPWSLVTLEQRMGRIHRIGQPHDVALFNLIASDALEGATYGALLDKLVDAANEMGGKMFDCLSLVGAEVLGADDPACTVPLADLFADDPQQRKARAAAIRAITKDQLRTAADSARRAADQLHTPMSDADHEAVVRLLLEDDVERLDPAPIEFWLQRLDRAGLVETGPSTLHAEVRELRETSRLALPEAFDARSLVVAGSGVRGALLQAGQMAAQDIIEVVPGTKPFSSLVEVCGHALQSALLRGSTAIDETAMSDYVLALFETPVHDDGRDTTWWTLVRYDGIDAGPVSFSLLANLDDGVAGQAEPLGDAVTLRLERAAHVHVGEVLRHRADERSTTVEQVRRDLKRLPRDLVHHLSGTAKRDASRRIRAAVDARLTALDQSGTPRPGATRCSGWLRVLGTAVTVDSDRATSEHIAVAHVKERLEAAQWQVVDVQGDNVGYDLKARRGHEVRLVEVKGVWGRASSDGIRLTANEYLQAGQHRGRYWLYVVDGCERPPGQLFGAWADPRAVFGERTSEITALPITGAELVAKQQIGDAA